LAAAVGVIAHSVSDLPALVDLLEIAGGHARLAAALRKVVSSRLKPIGGVPRPDPSLWRRGRL
jgi:hypothetical protein